MRHKSDLCFGIQMVQLLSEIVVVIAVDDVDSSIKGISIDSK